MTRYKNIPSPPQPVQEPETQPPKKERILQTKKEDNAREGCHLVPKKENRQPKRGMGRGQGPHLHEQDFGRMIRDTGEREWGAHRDTEAPTPSP